MRKTEEQIIFEIYEFIESLKVIISIKYLYHPNYKLAVKIGFTILNYSNLNLILNHSICILQDVQATFINIGWAIAVINPSYFTEKTIVHRANNSFEYLRPTINSKLAIILVLLLEHLYYLTRKEIAGTIQQL